MSVTSIKPIKSGGGRAAKYYTEAFYIEGGGSQGQWYGKGAEQLGLAGEVQVQHLNSVLSGFAPDGKAKLVRNAGVENRQDGWDLCFSPAKSISVFYALSSPEVRAQIDRDLHKSLEKALELAEVRAGITRIGAGGKRHEPASLIFATFQHLSSRANDPQLHIHALLMNASVRADGTTGAIWSNDIYNMKTQLSAVMGAELAISLRKSLGLEMKFVDGAWEVVGVPWQVCNDMSQRRAQIKEALSIKNLNSPAAAAIAALETRPDKKTEMSKDQLFESWRARSEALGWTSEHAEALINNPRFKKDQFAQENQTKWEKSQKMSEENTRHANSEFNYWQDGWRSGPRRSKAEELREKNRAEFFRKERERANENPEKAAKMEEQAQDFTKRHDNGWREILWSKIIWGADFRLQNKILFPKAPFWSPFRNWRIPTLRLVPKLPLSYHLWSGIKESLAERGNQSKRDHTLSEAWMRRRDRPRREDVSRVRMEDFFKVDIQALREQNHKKAYKERRAAMSKVRRAEKRRAKRVSKVRESNHAQRMSQSA